MKIEYKVDKDQIKLKDYLKEQGISRNLGRKIKLYGMMLVNGEKVLNYHLLRKGDHLIITFNEEKNAGFMPKNEKIEIIYEDEYFLVLDKPSNLSSQPSRKHLEDNLIFRIQHYFDSEGIESNIHLVTRLDFATSGLMIVAKSGFVHHQFTKIDILKKYLAKTEKLLPEKAGKISLPIIRENLPSIKRKVSEDGKIAITHYQLIDEKEKIVELILETGRTHQIRVHLSYFGATICGDRLYGIGGDEMYLYSYYLKFNHPITKKEIELIKYPKWYGGCICQI